MVGVNRVLVHEADPLLDVRMPYPDGVAAHALASARRCPSAKPSRPVLVLRLNRYFNLGLCRRCSLVGAVWMDRHPLRGPESSSPWAGQ